MGLEFKDMVGIIDPTLYVDEFSSKIADDADIAVLSLYVNNNQAAYDLTGWFEKGYQFVIDADQSPGEVEPNKYLVFVEIDRTPNLIEQIKELLEDLSTLTEFNINDWVIIHENVKTKFNENNLSKMLYMTPHLYKLNHEKELNEMRTAANLPVKKILTGRDEYLDLIRAQAGIDI